MHASYKVVMTGSNQNIRAISGLYPSNQWILFSEKIPRGNFGAGQNKSRPSPTHPTQTHAHSSPRAAASAHRCSRRLSIPAGSGESSRRGPPTQPLLLLLYRFQGVEPPNRNPTTNPRT